MKKENESLMLGVAGAVLLSISIVALLATPFALVGIIVGLGVVFYSATI